MFFVSTAAWEDLRNVFPNRDLKMNPSSPVICTTCDATTTRCQLLSPATEPYLDQAHSVTHVPVTILLVWNMDYCTYNTIHSTHRMYE